METATPNTADSPAATFTYNDSDGNSLTQTYYFGAPVAGTQLPGVAQAADSCAIGSPSEGTALIVPVTVTTTLNSDIDTSMILSFGQAMFTSPEALPAGAVQLLPIFVYYTSDGYTCANADDTTSGVEPSLSQGVPDTIDAWVVLNGAISPDYPNGNPASVSITGFYPDITPEFDDEATVTLTASGPAVCTGGGVQGVFLHIGGTVYGWEDCGSTASLG